MADATPARKSGRQRVPNRKYANGAFETLQLVLSSDSEDEELLQQQLLGAEDDSDEFPASQVAEDNDEEDDSLADEASDGSAIQTPVEEYEDAHSYASSDPGALDLPKSAMRKAKDHNVHRDPHVHSRGMPENPMRQDYVRTTTKLLSGEGVEDISHVVQSRDQWAADPTLPTRSHMRHGMSHTEDKRQMEATVGWDWYYDHGGREMFAQRQKVRLLNLEESLQYSTPFQGSQEFLMGPYGRQKKCSLSHSQALELHTAWTTAKDQGLLQRNGWMLNAGAPVECLDWAPNQDETQQYLALATVNSKSYPALQSPAFMPLLSPSAIQIWALNTSTDPGTKDRAVLDTILCTDWGDIKQLKWCQVPRMSRSPAFSKSPHASSTYLGLLAIICGDGFARVIDVRLNSNMGSRTLVQAQKYESSAFAAPAPNGNLSTCLAWLSSTDLAVGYSNGHLSIYDIYPDTNTEPPDTPDQHLHQEINTDNPKDPTPWLSMQLHPTYVSALNSAYPTYPSLLISSSLSGHLRLTSLLAPKTDYVYSLRTRSPPSSLAYCDSLLSVVGVEENSETIKMWGLRCFFTSFGCAHLPASPGPGHGNIDVGKFHPTVAAGCTDGSVMITNPMRKIIGRKLAGYQQRIFKHEWQPDTAIRIGQASGERRLGRSRITEGYKAEKVDLGARNNPRRGAESVPTTTIYEAETAVTALAWNPNVNCGGWLAVGWGSGLVRVQDVAID